MGSLRPDSAGLWLRRAPVQDAHGTPRRGPAGGRTRRPDQPWSRAAFGFRLPLALEMGHPHAPPAGDPPLRGPGSTKRKEEPFPRETSALMLGPRWPLGFHRAREGRGCPRTHLWGTLAQMLPRPQPGPRHQRSAVNPGAKPFSSGATGRSTAAGAGAGLVPQGQTWRPV